MALLEVASLSKSFSTRKRVFGRADRKLVVDDVSFHIERGETLALVGESGAGKSTTGRLILRLIEPDGGTIVLDGQDVRGLNRRRLRDLRSRAQMIFQDPYSSFDPRRSIAASVAEPLLIRGVPKSEREELASTYLDRVGITGVLASRYPGELSGGQLQRAAVARALTLHPSLIICDEPVAALDVSIRAQVLNLLSDLQSELGLSYLFVSHDLALVEVFADRVAVMKSGRIVEMAESARIYQDPQHEYTKQLLAAIPRPRPTYLELGVSPPSTARP